MSEFVMEGRDEHAFQALDEFTQGYIEALFFTDSAPGVTTEQWQTSGYESSEGSIPGDVGFSDLAPETLARIIADCKAFRDGLPKDGSGRTYIDLAVDYAPRDYTEHSAGVDFWLTRNHHGAGFWDRELGEAGDKLTKAAHGYAETTSYLGDDGKVYLS